MIFEHLQNSFSFEDLPNNFFELLMVWTYVVTRCIPKNIIWVLGIIQLLALAKFFQAFNPS
jgi:hypothetical protein